MIFGDNQIGFDYDGKIMKVLNPRVDKFPSNELQPTHEIVEVQGGRKFKLTSTG